MNCYVTNPKQNSKLPSELNKDNTLFYPEAGMTTYEVHTTSRPRDYHIVTDSFFLVSLYSFEGVFVWNGSKWINPPIQTYGTSYSIIMSDILI